MTVEKWVWPYSRPQGWPDTGKLTHRVSCIRCRAEYRAAKAVHLRLWLRGHGCWRDT